MRSKSETKRSKQSPSPSPSGRFILPRASTELFLFFSASVWEVKNVASLKWEKECENPLQPCDIIGKQEAGPQRNKEDGGFESRIVYLGD
ncbi:hypothetical protein M0R45_001613 [Rubus argutus]|uniref:Uncharacterized protein n=1 Tax=Rubus argutus TaxID=59490 RepID=A0AAW1VG98_RUBAR